MSRESDLALERAAACAEHGVVGCNLCNAMDSAGVLRTHDDDPTYRDICRQLGDALCDADEMRGAYYSLLGDIRAVFKHIYCHHMNAPELAAFTRLETRLKREAL